MKRLSGLLAVAALLGAAIGSTAEGPKSVASARPSVVKTVPTCGETGVDPATGEIRVTFSKSGKNLHWDPRADSLLEFAEAEGVSVEYGCRAGSCGTCQTRLEGGEVTYNQPPDADVEPGHCLLCIAKPKNDVTLAT